MKRAITVVILLCVLLVGCQKSEDFFEEFKGAFRADVKGELNGVSFGAIFEAGQAEEGKLAPITVTFYAPETLCDTILKRDKEGACRLCYEGTEIMAEGGIAMALFGLFPTGGVTKTAVDGMGNTVVTAGEKQVIFQKDGTPLKIEAPDVRVEILSFERGK